MLSPTITVRVADAAAMKALLERVAALLDKLDDPPEGSCLDEEWCQWMSEVADLRNAVYLEC